MSRVRHVAVVGRDAALWLSALVLHRAMGPAGVTVEAIELPSHLVPADVYTAVPSLSGLHAMLGLTEPDVLRTCAGVPMLGQRFVGWSGGDDGFVHGYDLRQPGIEDVDFLQFWIHARTRGMNVPWEDFSFAASAARMGRLPLPDADPESPAALAPGYHLHARAYAGAMRNYALAQGIAHRATDQVSVETAGDRIASVRLGDGANVGADLYIDASGPDAALLSALPGGEAESWSHWLPCNRVMRASAPPLHPLPPFGEITAFRAGWVGRFPLQNRTALVAVYDDAQIDASEMAGTLARIAGTSLREAPEVAAFASQARTPWIGNCVAIGEAAANLDLLDAVSLHAIHAGLTHLLAFCPADTTDMPESALYNRTMRATFESLRDFQITHYRLNNRTGEPLWDRARATPAPESLEVRLRLFAARGQVPPHDEECFQPQNWAALFVGHGLIPRDHDPRVDLMPEREQIIRFHTLLAHIAESVRPMPTVAQYLAGPTAG